MAKAPKTPQTEEEAAAEAAAALQAQLAALRAELAATSSAAGQAAAAERNSLKAKIRAASQPGQQQDPKPLKQTLVNGGAIAQLRNQAAAAKSAKAAVGSIGGGAAKPIETVEAGNKGLKLLAKNLGISKAQLRAPLTAGAIELSKLALGIRGMGQLSAIEARAGFQLRQLFKGIDPMPVVRAADRLSQVFNKTSVTGKALEGIFGRAFGYIFGQIENLAPYAHTAFQGMVLAALLLENGWLRASIALQPLTDAIEEVIGPTDDMQAAAWVGGAAFTALGIAAAAAAIPVVAVGAAFKAVAAAIEQATKLYREWDSTALKKASYGVGEAGERVNQGSNYRSDADLRLSDAQYAAKYGNQNNAPSSGTAATPGLLDPSTKTGAMGAAAEASGKAYSDGLKNGILSGAAGVREASAAVAGAIDSTVRTKTETNSPSRVAYRTGEEQPAGLVGGMRSGIPDVAAASADMAGAANGGGTSSGGGARAAAYVAPLVLNIINNWPVGVAADRNLEARFDDMLRGAVRAISQALGKPVTT